MRWVGAVVPSMPAMRSASFAPAMPAAVGPFASGVGALWRDAGAGSGSGSIGGDRGRGARGSGGVGGGGDGPDRKGRKGHDTGSTIGLLTALGLGGLLLLLEGCDSGDQHLPGGPTIDILGPHTDAFVFTPPDANTSVDTTPSDDMQAEVDETSPPADVEYDITEDANVADAAPDGQTLETTTPDAADVAIDVSADVGPPIPSNTFCTNPQVNECLTEETSVVPASIALQVATVIDLNVPITLNADQSNPTTVDFDAQYFLNPEQYGPIAVTFAKANGFYPETLIKTAGTSTLFSAGETIYVVDPDDPTYYNDNNIALYPPVWKSVTVSGLSISPVYMDNPEAPDQLGPLVVWLRGSQSFVSPTSQKDATCAAAYFYPCLSVLEPMTTP